MFTLLLAISSLAATAVQAAPAALPNNKLYSQLDLEGVSHSVRKDLSWKLQMGYQGTTFFDGFDFFDEQDPSHGSAFQDGLAFWTESGTPGIQAEHWANLSVGTPRNSVRITSKALYAGGLFIFDVALMPWGCGVWPAIWTLGYSGTWPSSGEIDIVEGVQDMTANHTTPGCTIESNPQEFTGSMIANNCDSSTGGAGCSIVSNSNSSYGETFNSDGGGVYAMLWNGDGIRIWNWQRSVIPGDVTSGSPQPTTWGRPVAAFDRTSCDPYTYFGAQVLVLNVNLCGDWAGSTYQNFNNCPGTCAERIADPANLANTVMLINSIKIYQQSGFSSVVGQAITNSNQTGAGGAVPANGTRTTTTLPTPSVKKSSASALRPSRLSAAVFLSLLVAVTRTLL